MKTRRDIAIPLFPHRAGIPHHIFQTYPDTNLPAEIAANIDHLKRLNPEYQYRLFVDAEIRDWITAAYGRHVTAAYDRISDDYGAAKADLFRYLLLYKEGGVYLDIKSSLRQPLREVIRDDDGFILSHWEDPTWGNDPECAHVAGGEYQQWFIVAAQGHPYLRAAIVEVLRRIDAYRPWRQGVGRFATRWTTGPYAYTNAIFPIVGDHPHREIRHNGEIGFVYSIYDSHLEHRRLGRGNYRYSKEPVIRQGIGGRARWYLHRARRKVMRMLARD